METAHMRTHKTGEGKKTESLLLYIWTNVVVCPRKIIKNANVFHLALAVLLLILNDGVSYGYHVDVIKCTCMSPVGKPPH